ncbi:MAG: PGF-CTERM sorting domain-containing protein [Halobacteriales archaeon]
MFDTHASRVATVVIAAALLASAAVPAAGAAEQPDPGLQVDLREDGTARVTLTLTYDLSTDDERIAFRSLENDSDARAAARERFADRMAAIAESAATETGREMTVADPRIELATAGDVGVVKLSVRWTGFAAADDDRLRVAEPFASGFQPDRRVVVTLPDGYEVATASPDPSESGDGRLVWAAGTDLSGFELVADGGGSGTPATSTDDSSVLSPGFGPVVALLGVAGAVLLVARRRVTGD